LIMESKADTTDKLKLNPPILLINFKAYPQGTGENAVKLAEIVEDVSNSFKDVTFVIAPQTIDLRLVNKVVKNTKIFAQHVDPVHLGAFTGSTPPELVKKVGAVGTLLNHSERRVTHEIIKKTIEINKEVGLITCACAGSPEESGKIAQYYPEFLAFEPPELIGTGISVSKAKPEVLKESIENILAKGNGKVIPLCGAGISNGDDVAKAIELGAKGVLVASAVVKSKDPYSILHEMAEAASV